MIDLKSEFGQYVERRLKNETVIWLTTVTPHGVAQPNPVWFYWDEKVIIMYSQPGAFRIRNIRHNPIVALNLKGADLYGNHAVVLHGEAQMRPDYHQPHPGYMEKYAKYLPELNVTFEQLAADYSVEIVINPTNLRRG